MTCSYLTFKKENLFFQHNINKTALKQISTNLDSVCYGHTTQVVSWKQSGTDSNLGLFQYYSIMCTRHYVWQGLNIPWTMLRKLLKFHTFLIHTHLQLQHIYTCDIILQNSFYLQWIYKLVQLSGEVAYFRHFYYIR